MLMIQGLNQLKAMLNKDQDKKRIRVLEDYYMELIWLRDLHYCLIIKMHWYISWHRIHRRQINRGRNKRRLCLRSWRKKQRLGRGMKRYRRSGRSYRRLKWRQRRKWWQSLFRCRRDGSRRLIIWRRQKGKRKCNSYVLLLLLLGWYWENRKRPWGKCMKRLRILLILN